MWTMINGNKLSLNTKANLFFVAFYVREKQNKTNQNLTKPNLLYFSIVKQINKQNKQTKQFKSLKFGFSSFFSVYLWWYDDIMILWYYDVMMLWWRYWYSKLLVLNKQQLAFYFYFVACKVETISTTKSTIWIIEIFFIIFCFQINKLEISSCGQF